LKAGRDGQLLKDVHRWRRKAAPRIGGIGLTGSIRRYRRRNRAKTVELDKQAA
jgi:hypothetical protein